LRRSKNAALGIARIVRAKRDISTNVRVITVKPGFVATRTTAGIRLAPMLTAQPEEVGEAVMRAIRQMQDVIYIRSVMILIG